MLGGVVRCKFGRHARVNSAAMRVTKAPDGVGAETVEQRYPHRLASFDCEIRRVSNAQKGCLLSHTRTRHAVHATQPLVVQAERLPAS